MLPSIFYLRTLGQKILMMFDICFDHCLFCYTLKPDNSTSQQVNNYIKSCDFIVAQTTVRIF